MLKLIENPGMAVCIAQHISLEGLFWYDTCISAPAQQEDEGGEEETRARYKSPTQDILGNTVGGQTQWMVGGREMCPDACQLVWV